MLPVFSLRYYARLSGYDYTRDTISSESPGQSHYNSLMLTKHLQRTGPVLCELFRQGLLCVRFPAANKPTASRASSIEALNLSYFSPQISMDLSTYDMYDVPLSPRPEQDPTEIPWPATPDAYDGDRLSDASSLSHQEGQPPRRRLHRLAQLLNESERHCTQLIEERSEMQYRLNGAAIETLECQRDIAVLQREKGNLSRALDDARREIARLKKKVQHCDKEHVFLT